jgi:hypothetical protein
MDRTQTPWNEVFPEKLRSTIVLSKSKSFLHFMEPKGTLPCSLVLVWGRWIQSMSSHSISLRSVLVLPCYVRLRLPEGLFPSCFLASPRCVFVFSPHMPQTLSLLSYLGWSPDHVISKVGSCLTSVMSSKMWLTWLHEMCLLQYCMYCSTLCKFEVT